MTHHNLPQNATNEDGLSPAQEQVLMALLAGRTVTDAAKAGNVDRTTVYRWLRRPDLYTFRSVLDRKRLELRQAMSARLLALLPKAADCLEAELNAGDSKAALSLLKGLGYLQ
jgi:hypothetical protein